MSISEADTAKNPGYFRFVRKKLEKQAISQTPVTQQKSAKGESHSEAAGNFTCRAFTNSDFANAATGRIFQNRLS